MKSQRTRNRLPIAIGTLLAACGAAQAQTFEAPTYNGSAAGTILTGQDGWYLPDSGGLDAVVFTYAGNAQSLPANPAGNAQMHTGVGGANVSRAQHAVNLSGSNVWTVTYDFCCKYAGVLPAVDNISSWSLQVVPTNAAGTRQFQTLASWGTTIPPDHTTTADVFNLGLGYVPSGGAAALVLNATSVPSPAWLNLPVNNWYRISVKWDNVTARILTAKIQNLTTGGPVTTDYISNLGMFLFGGLNSAVPSGTEYRLFAGGANSVAAYDNVSIVASTEGIGSCCLPAGGCSFIGQNACADQGGIYKGDGILCANAGCPSPGACCQDTGSCSVISSTACAAAFGEYLGDGSSCGSCPATGACCKEDGTCVQAYVAHCTSLGGLFRGNGIACASSSAACFPFGFTGDDELNLPDVGDMLATSAPVNGFGQPISRIHGAISLGDRADVYRLTICNRSTLNITTAGNGNTLDTELALFDSTGKGLTIDDDIGNGATFVNPQSIITGQFVPNNGVHYLAVSTFHNAAPATFNSPLDSTGAAIFVEPSPWGAGTTPPGGTGFPEWSPNGPSVSRILTTTPPAWSQDPDAFGAYTVALTGACFLGCYANCDGSSIAPILNANDFQCYLNSFAGGQNGYGYANCDASSVVPVLNANDFQCFLNSFAAGCPS